MATESALGRRRSLATLRIEKVLSDLGQGRTFTLPTFSRFGSGMLIVNQMEAIADFLEGVSGGAVAKSDEPATGVIDVLPIEPPNEEDTAETTALVVEAEPKNKNKTGKGKP